jgi:hypothetical protein
MKSKITFHGAYKSKREAIKKERKVKGFIKTYNIKGHKRYVVMKSKRHA